MSTTRDQFLFLQPSLQPPLINITLPVCQFIVFTTFLTCFIGRIHFILIHDLKYKSNVVIFCCKKFKDIHTPNFILNDEILTRVNKCKYLGHVLTEVLSDDDDMARQYKR